MNKKDWYETYKEIMRAYYEDDAEIQYFSNSRNLWMDVIKPIWCFNLQYRIKPAEYRDVTEKDLGKIVELSNSETFDDKYEKTLDYLLINCDGTRYWSNSLSLWFRYCRIKKD